MKTYDTDNDGRLGFVDFLHVILPSDYNVSLIKKKYEKEHNIQVNEYL
jgi:hypothetical protein